MPYIGAIFVSRCPSYVTKNRLGIYILQMRVPKHIRQNSPNTKPLIQRSLRTRNRRDALRAARKLVVWMEDNEFDLDKFEHEARRQDELFHVGKPLFEELNRLNDEGDQLALEEFLAHLNHPEEEALRFVCDKNNALIDQMDALAKAGDQQRLSEFVEGIPTVFRSRIAPQQPQPTVTVAPPVAPERSKLDITLDEAFERWKSEFKASMKPSSYEEYERMIGFFVRLVQHFNGGVHPHISELSNELITDYRNAVLAIPSGARTAGKPIEDILALKGKPKSPETLKGTFGNVGHLTTWLAANGYPLQAGVHNVLTHFRKIKAREKKKRLPFDDQDLLALFDSEQYKLGKFKRASDYWVPLIALFSGMARNEIIQLEVADITEIEGVPSIDINDRGDKRLKVEASADEGSEDTTGRPRKVPIHPVLIELGFLDFVTWSKGKRRKRLFPDEKRNSRGHFGAFGNRFRNYRDKVGASPRNEKEFRDFHSFRHLVKTNLRNATKDDGVIDDILGHTSKLRSDAGRTYDHSERIELKLKTLRKLHYECIDFASFTSWKRHAFARA